MSNTTTLNETTRSPIDGTEYIRLATPGANWKATIAAMFGTVAGVTNQIVGTGTLTAGATGAGFTLNFAASTLSGTIPNVNLANSSVTIGSTSVALGATAATIAGLTLTAPVLGVATATSLAIGGATIGGNVLAVTGTSLFNSQITNSLGTIATSLPFTITNTWNASGVTFNAFLVNVVTATPSAAASTIADFQVGGTSQFSIRKDGAAFLGTGGIRIDQNSIGMVGGPNVGDVGIGNFTNNSMTLYTNSVGRLFLSADGSRIGTVATMLIGWAPSTVITAALDTNFSRVSAGVVQLGTSSANASGSLNLTNLTASGTITAGAGPALLTSPSAAVLQFGAADVASGAVAQTIQPQSNTGASTTGPDFTIAGSTGTTAGGAIVFKPAATTARATAFTVNSAGVIVASGKALQLGNAAVTGLVAGALAALTTASLTVSDNTGTVYRIPAVTP